MDTADLNILALNTSSSYCSVALQHNKCIEEICSDSIDRSKKLLTIIEQLLSKLAISELSLLAFAAGPGSLTGLKIGSCIMQALNLAYQKPIIKISTLEGLALSAYQKFSINTIIPCMDASMGQIYYGIYEFSKQRPTTIPKQIYKDTIGKTEDLAKIIQKMSNYLLVGDGVKNLNPDLCLKKETIDPDCFKNSFLVNEIKTNATSILHLAHYRYQKYGIISNDVDPIYLCYYS